MLFLFICLLATEILAGGPFNVEIHQINIQLNRAALDAMIADAGNQNLSVDAQVNLFGTQYPAKLDIHGASSRSYRKKSFGVKFAKETAPKVNLWNYVGDSQEKIRKFILNAAWVDETFMRNKLTWDVAMDIGGVAPRVVWAELYFNGIYEGFYAISEQIDDEMWKRLGWNNKANVYKSITHDGNFFPKADPMLGYSKKGNQDGPSDDLRVLLDVLERTPKNFDDFEKSVQPIISVRDWFTYLYSCVYSNNVDGYDKNYYLYHDHTINSPFRVIPWDSDATWGNTWNGVPVAPGNNLWGGDGMSSRIFSIEEYTYSYLTNFKCLIEKGALRTNVILAKVNAWANAISSFVKRDEDKWFPNGGRVETKPFPRAVQEIRDYVTNRSVNFLKAVNSKLASLRRVNSDRVLNNNGVPYFTCGVAPNPGYPKIPKTPIAAAKKSPSPAKTLRVSTICQNSEGAISCSPNTVIQIRNATYGRTDTTTCVAPNMGNTDCNAVATDRVSTLCNNRNSCTLQAQNTEFTNPCPGIQKYLRVYYLCVGNVNNALASNDSPLDTQSSSTPSTLSTPLIVLIVFVAIFTVAIVFAAIFVGVKKQQLEQESRP